ncbi:hypothetical protein BT69DRAFT_1315906 [Atractiella rhizophila]|nr:hypothetical protein BT69DRAFT_1315906 [Atractiella rhizophila]
MDQTALRAAVFKVVFKAKANGEGETLTPKQILERLSQEHSPAKRVTPEWWNEGEGKKSKKQVKAWAREALEQKRARESYDERLRYWRALGTRKTRMVTCPIWFMFTGQLTSVFKEEPEEVTEEAILPKKTTKKNKKPETEESEEELNERRKSKGRPPNKNRVSNKGSESELSQSEEEQDSSEPDTPPSKKRKAASQLDSEALAPAPKKSRKNNKQTFKSAEFIDSEGQPIETLEETVDKEKKVQKRKKSEEVSKKVKKSVKGSESKPKDEETIDRLKSYVVACGVRKRWNVEFGENASSSEKIKKLREILKELGMSDGRLSMAKAKEIKAKRDLEKEMADLKSTSRAVAVDEEGTGRATRSKRNVVPSDDEDDTKAEKKRITFDFLGDQSDSDDD